MQEISAKLDFHQKPLAGNKASFRRAAVAAPLASYMNAFGSTEKILQALKLHPFMRGHGGADGAIMRVEGSYYRTSYE